MLEKMRPYWTPFAVSGVKFLGMEFTCCWIRLTVPTAACDTCVELSLTFSARTSACWYVITITQPRTQSSCLAYSHGKHLFFLSTFHTLHQVNQLAWAFRRAFDEELVPASPSVLGIQNPRFDSIYRSAVVQKNIRCGKPTICRSFS